MNECSRCPASMPTKKTIVQQALSLGQKAEHRMLPSPIYRQSSPLVHSPSSLLLPCSPWGLIILPVPSLLLSSHSSPRAKNQVPTEPTKHISPIHVILGLLLALLLELAARSLTDRKYLASQSCNPASPHLPPPLVPTTVSARVWCPRCACCCAVYQPGLRRCACVRVCVRVWRPLVIPFTQGRKPFRFGPHSVCLPADRQRKTRRKERPVSIYFHLQLSRPFGPWQMWSATIRPPQPRLPLQPPLPIYLDSSRRRPIVIYPAVPPPLP